MPQYFTLLKNKHRVSVFVIMWAKKHAEGAAYMDGYCDAKNADLLPNIAISARVRVDKIYSFDDYDVFTDSSLPKVTIKGR